MNNNIGEKYLPIGTVVMLKGGSKRLMITGFCSIPTSEKNTIYDYAGCLYPEGFLSSDQAALFNHDQIEKIYYTGLIDEEEKIFKSNLKDLVKKASSENNVLINNQVNIENVPPIGPGLPGYVATQSVATNIVKDTESSLNSFNTDNQSIQFDTNNNINA